MVVGSGLFGFLCRMRTFWQFLRWFSCIARRYDCLTVVWIWIQIISDQNSKILKIVKTKKCTDTLNCSECGAQIRTDIAQVQHKQSRGNLVNIFLFEIPNTHSPNTFIHNTQGIMSTRWRIDNVTNKVKESLQTFPRSRYVYITKRTYNPVAVTCEHTQTYTPPYTCACLYTWTNKRKQDIHVHTRMCRSITRTHR